MPPGAEEISQRRRRFARRARVVGWVKVLLPVVALSLIGAIFYASRDRGDISDLFTAEEIARLGAGLQVDNPRLAGVTPDDQPYELTAKAAVPDGAMADRISFDTPAGSIEMAERRITASAGSGLLDREAMRLELDGDVAIQTSDGWRAETGRLVFRLEGQHVESAGSVAAEGPNGTLKAGSFRAERSGGEDGAARIWFENGVRVVFTPPPKQTR